MPAHDRDSAPLHVTVSLLCGPGMVYRSVRNYSRTPRPVAYRSFQVSVGALLLVARASALARIEAIVRAKIRRAAATDSRCSTRKFSHASQAVAARSAA